MCMSYSSSLKNRITFMLISRKTKVILLHIYSWKSGNWSGVMESSYLLYPVNQGAPRNFTRINLQQFLSLMNYGELWLLFEKATTNYLSYINPWTPYSFNFFLLSGSFASSPHEKITRPLDMARVIKAGFLRRSSECTLMPWKTKDFN